VRPPAAAEAPNRPGSQGIIGEEGVRSTATLAQPAHAHRGTGPLTLEAKVAVLGKALRTRLEPRALAAPVRLEANRLASPGAAYLGGFGPLSIRDRTASA
jgi:hypothetical protein